MTKSRQQIWQEKRRIEGRCSICGQLAVRYRLKSTDKIKTSAYCEKHLIVMRERTRSNNKVRKPQKPKEVVEFVERKLTDEQINKFSSDLHGFLEGHKEICELVPGDTDIEVLCEILIECVSYDLEQQKDPLIKSCLEGTIEHLRRAGFAHYASFK
jgi:hypothetical protein